MVHLEIKVFNIQAQLFLGLTEKKPAIKNLLHDGSWRHRSRCSYYYKSLLSQACPDCQNFEQNFSWNQKAYNRVCSIKIIKSFHKQL